VHGPTTDDELIALYSRSVVSLGFVEVYDRHDPLAPVLKHVHLREFEAPMSGALYCTGLTDELAEMFVPDKEVVVYSSEDELVDKVKAFLLHPERGEPIRAAGRARALADHTYQRRFGTLFEHLGMRASPCPG
jgi:spore maturation protein CgeB